MQTNHVNQMLEAYLDDRLPAAERRRVETHLAACQYCSRRLVEAKRLHRELGPVMQEMLGRPTLPPRLHHQVRQAIAEQEARRPFPFNFNWMAPARVLNAVGTVAVVTLLAVGAYSVIQGQIPGAALLNPSEPPTTALTAGGSNDEATPAANITPTAAAPPTAQALAVATATPTLLPAASTGDTLETPPAPPEATTNSADSAQSVPPATLPDNLAVATRTKSTVASEAKAPPAKPTGTLAYGLFDGRMYQIHLLSPDGRNHRLLPLPGVSEPALHPADNDIPLAFRSWNDPSGSRTLVTSDLQGDSISPITNFWEDAQPDWSPVENRVIFASQRESDRRWRLYSAWGDGSLEVNLRREGQAPTFAPDGYRFAFESCNDSARQCGLWIADLDHSEHGAQVLLADDLAKAPDWSPVSEEIVYMANPNDNWDLYLTNSSGDTLRRLTDDPANDGLPVWSPDGRWLAFVSDRGGEWGLWILEPESGELQQAVAFEAGHSLASPARLPYNQHGQREWWREQISWGP